MDQKDLAERLGMLGFPMFERNPRHAANETVADMAKEDDLRLWEGFPVALATAVEKGWFDYSEARRWLGSAEAAQRFDALLALAVAVWDAAGLKTPATEQLKAHLTPEQESFRRQLLPALRNGEDFTLLGHPMSGDRVRNTFERHYEAAGSAHAAGGGWRSDLLSMKERHDLMFALSQFFSPRQQELIFKKMRGEKLTKTEREYYSRAVKKKLVALTNQELQRLAQALR